MGIDANSINQFISPSPWSQIPNPISPSLTHGPDIKSLSNKHDWFTKLIWIILCFIVWIMLWSLNLFDFHGLNFHIKTICRQLFIITKGKSESIWNTNVFIFKYSSQPKTNLACQQNVTCKSPKTQQKNLQNIVMERTMQFSDHKLYQTLKLHNISDPWPLTSNILPIDNKIQYLSINWANIFNVISAASSKSL